MTLLSLPDDVFLHMSGICGPFVVRVLGVTCRHFRCLLWSKQRHVLLANPVRIISGQLSWLSEHISSHMVCEAEWPNPSMVQRLGALKLVYTVSRHYDTQAAFLATVSVAVRVFSDVTMVIQSAPLFIPAFVRAMSTLAGGGRLVLDLSYHEGLTAAALKPLWKPLLQLSELRLKVRNTDINDAVLFDIAQNITLSLEENQPIVWTAVKLGLAHNMITDRGMTALVQSLGRCPQLTDLTLDMSYNDVTGAEKLRTVHNALRHIPSLRIKLDSDCWDADVLSIGGGGEPCP